MPPKKPASASKAVSAAAAPSKSGRQRTLTNKQQQLLTQQKEKDEAAKQRAITDAVRSEQRIEEINGFHKRKLPELSPDEEDLGPESEDDDNEPVSSHTAFSSVTIPPIIKTAVRNGRTLVYRIPNMDREICSEPQSQTPRILAPATSKTLVRRAAGDNSSTAYPSMPTKHAGPYTPQVQAEYGRGDGSFYSSHPNGSRGRIRTGDFDDLTRSIIEETISIYRAQIGAVEPFPERADDRDTVKQAWVEVCTGRNLRVELEEDIFKFIVCRASQARGYAKTTSRPYFISAYKIDSHGSKREIRDSDPVSKTGIFRAPLIQTLINKIWFKNKEDDGAIHPEFSEDGMLSMATIAFVQTVIENNLDEWVTGEHVDVPFTATAYKAKYRAHLNHIMDFEKKTREADIIPRLLTHMLKAARKHAKVSGEGAAQTSNISDGEIEAAKLEWADLVLSDDE
ncbi:hypothetical protein BDZ97DRAFT_1905964 [Flammula alnicola]|nr:hypothetical protein BDZ97DRAFT_1905964 [Flammula alnicola]